MNNQSGTSFLLPVLLAGVGIAALALAIILVPSMARKYAEARPCTGAAAAEASVPTVVPGAADRIVAPPQAPPVEPASPAKGAEPAAEVDPAPAPLSPPAPAPAADAAPEGTWSIEMDPGDYALLGDGDAVIDAIVLVLARNPKAVVSLTGVNNPSKSSKRAKRAADIVKERIVADVGVTARQAVTGSAQDPAVDGLIVRAEIVGGGR